jgi:hypothetical protein
VEIVQNMGEQFNQKCLAGEDFSIERMQTSVQDFHSSKLSNFVSNQN